VQQYQTTRINREVPRYIIPCPTIPSFLGPPAPETSLKAKDRVSH